MVIIWLQILVAGSLSDTNMTLPVRQRAEKLKDSTKEWFCWKKPFLVLVNIFKKLTKKRLSVFFLSNFPDVRFLLENCSTQCNANSIDVINHMEKNMLRILLSNVRKIYHDLGNN